MGQWGWGRLKRKKMLQGIMKSFWEKRGFGRGFVGMVQGRGRKSEKKEEPEKSPCHEGKDQQKRKEQ